VVQLPAVIRLRVLLVACAALALVPAIVFAQTAELRGSVADSSGAALGRHRSDE
jgi:hypothetical protein